MATYTIVDFVKNLPESRFASILYSQVLEVNGHACPPCITDINEGVQQRIIQENPDAEHDPEMSNGLTPLIKLMVTGHHIHDISGLKYMTRLRVLNLSENRIASLRGVEFPASLTDLNLSENRIASLEGVLFPTGLKKLILSRNKIANLFGDVLPPQRPPPLQIVSGPSDDMDTAIARAVHSLQPSDVRKAVMLRVIEIPCVSRLVSLKELDLSHNRLTCLKRIEFLTSLEDLHLEHNNKLTSLAGLTLPLSLKVLNTTGNPIVDLDGLKIGDLRWDGIDDVSYLWTQGSHTFKKISPLVAMFERVEAPSPPPPHEHNSDNEEEGSGAAAQGGKRKKQRKQIKQTKKNNKKYRRKTKKNKIKNEKKRKKC
jgi:Leucine-rich repeat (LRR) protein